MKFQGETIEIESGDCLGEVASKAGFCTSITRTEISHKGFPYNGATKVPEARLTDDPIRPHSPNSYCSNLAPAYRMEELLATWSDP